jgi:hypothetical protein
MISGFRTKTSAQMRQLQALCYEIAACQEAQDQQPQTFYGHGADAESDDDVVDGEFNWDKEHEMPFALPAYIADPKKNRRVTKRKPPPAKTAEQKQHEKEQRERWSAPLTQDEQRKTLQEIYRDDMLARGQRPNMRYVQSPPRYLTKEMKEWPRRQIFQFIRAHRDAVMLQKKLEDGKPITRCEKCGTIVSQNVDHKCFILGSGLDTTQKGVPLKRQTVAITTGNRLSVQERDVVDEEKLKENLNALAALEETRQILRRLPAHGVAVPPEAVAIADEPMQPEAASSSGAGDQGPAGASKRGPEETVEASHKVVVTELPGEPAQDTSSQDFH